MFFEAIPQATEETMMLHKPNWHAVNHSFNLKLFLGKSPNPSEDYPSHTLPCLRNARTLKVKTGEIGMHRK